MMAFDRAWLDKLMRTISRRAATDAEVRELIGFASEAAQQQAAAGSSRQQRESLGLHPATVRGTSRKMKKKPMKKKPRPVVYPIGEEGFKKGLLSGPGEG